MRKLPFFKIIAASLLIFGCMAFGSCAKQETADGSAVQIKRKAVSSNELQFAAPTEGAPIAIFETDAGQVSAVLYPEHAPQAYENFTTLASQGFYDGTPFYRVVNEFCVQGGLDAEGNANTIWQGNGYPIETTDALHHYAGALCAPTDTKGLAGSPFYVVTALPNAFTEAELAALTAADYREDVVSAYQLAGGTPYLDYTDTVFGQVYEGMDVMDAIAQTPTDETETPITPVLIQSVTITTYKG